MEKKKETYARLQKEIKNLKEENFKLSELIESITDIFFAFDKSLKYTYWNKACENLTGILSENAVGKGFYEIFPGTPETIEAEKLYKKVLKTKKASNITNTNFVNDIKYTFEINAYPTKTGLSVFVKDITERKQAEEEKQISEERFSAFMNSASDSFCLLDSELNFIEINKKALEILGKKKEDVIGKNIEEIIPDIKSSGRYTLYKEVIKTGKPIIFEDYNTNSVFGFKHFILKSFKVGSGLGIIVFDITNQKIIESELKKTQELALENAKAYQDLVETTSDLITVVDKQGKFIFVNHASLKFFGIAPEICIGKSAFDFIHPDDVEFTKKKFSEWILSKENDFSIENRQISTDGSIVQVFWNIHIARIDDHVIKITSFARDITKLKDMEHELSNRVDELERWYKITLERESRAMELKQEINELLAKIGEKARYKED